MRGPSFNIQSCVINQKLADHYFTACQWTPLLSRHDTQNFPGEDKTTDAWIVDHRKLDLSIKSFTWSSLLDSNDACQVYKKFCEQIQFFRNEAKRPISFRKRKKESHWITPDIIKAIEYKDLLWRRSKRAPNNSALHLEFKIERNKVCALIRASKRRYFRGQFDKAANNPKQTWSIVNQLRGKTTHPESPLQYFKDDPQLVANSFNNYFASTSRVTSEASPGVCSLNNSICESALLPTITDVDLHSLVFSFKETKPNGIDGISIRILRRNFAALTTVLLFMLNGFITTGVIPRTLKTALVKPFFKKGQKDKYENYRPISILPVIGQLLEKHLLITMSGFLNKFSVISPRQFGFVQGLGTVSLLEEFSDLLHSAFDNNLYSCALFLDISKAFDSVDHSILLQKLHKLGFRGNFHTLLTNYLSNRSQVVALGGLNMSTQVSLTCGVPQGSIISPLLFNIYVNDLEKNILTCHIFQYADDTVLVACHTNYTSAVRILQQAVFTAMNWFRDNRIKVNASKTSLVCFRNPLKQTVTNIPLFIHTSDCTSCSCTAVSYVNSVKYLGVYFDSDLAWNTHLSYICSKLRSTAWLLYTIRHLAPICVRRAIASSLAYGVLRYGITILSNCPIRWQVRIDNILRNLLKSVAYNCDLTECESIFQYLGLPSFQKLFVNSVILRHFWMDDFKKTFMSSRVLRDCPRYVVPRSYTRYGQATRDIYVPKIFNSLPDDIFTLTSKKQLKKFLIDWTLP